MLNLTQGNLLESDAEALVNTVNTVGVMGKGIALQFKKAFPDNFKAYAIACKAEKVVPGKVFVFQNPALRGPRYILNFPTKRHYREKSRLSDLSAGLNDLVDVIEREQIQSIALPPLGCGHGGLSWKTVYPMIEEALGSLEGVRVDVYPPGGTPDAADMPNQTSRPRMTEGRAAFIELMRRYVATGWDYRLSLLELQKLAYFLQESGQSLKLRFEPMTYGPYADQLRHVLNRIEGHFVQGFGDGQSKPDTPLEPMAEAVEEAGRYLQTKPAMSQRLERVSRLIENFETPFGMELLATVHWVARHGINDQVANDPQEATRLVHQWNERKRRAFEPEKVKMAWDRLAQEGWLN